jgi:hypothetical protein
MPQTKEQKNEYMRNWYASKVANDPNWVKNKREQTKKSVAKHYKKVGYENSTQKKYYHTHIKEPEFKLKTLEQKLKSYYRNRVTNMLYKAQWRSKKYNLPFNLELSDIKIPEKCPVFNIKFLDGKGHDKMYSPSLDKIDPKFGYVKGNVQVISLLANLMKQNANKEQLLAFAAWINKTYG